jgi:hypothetical protein
VLGCVSNFFIFLVVVIQYEIFLALSGLHVQFPVLILSDNLDETVQGVGSSI